MLLDTKITNYKYIWPRKKCIHRFILNLKLVYSRVTQSNNYTIYFCIYRILSINYYGINHNFIVMVNNIILFYIYSIYL